MSQGKQDTDCAANRGDSVIRAMQDYEPELSASELDEALRGLCALERRCERLVCRYLADLADRPPCGELGWFSDVHDYARARLGIGVKATRERVRIGRALRTLPHIERAFLEGSVSYSRVREVTLVATTQDELRWLQLAKELPMHELERQVVAKVGGKRLVQDQPAEAHWRTPETVELRMHLPAATWALVKRAMEGARQAAEHSLSDAEALEAVALEALSRLCDPDSTSIADPRKAVVLYRCRRCGESELETTAGAVALPAEQAERLSSGAKRIDLETEGWGEAEGERRREGEAEPATGSSDAQAVSAKGDTEFGVGGAIPAAVRRAVLARDRGRCRVCGKRRYVDVHHLKARSDGGAHTRTNCAVICTRCHAALHEGKLRLQGDAEGELRLERAPKSTTRVEDEAFHTQSCAQERAESPELGSSAELQSTALPAVLEDAHRVASLAADAPASVQPPEGTRERTTPDASLLEGSAPSWGSSAQAKQVLEVMGGRGGWCTDQLVAATGLRVSEVSVALYELVLAHRVRRDWPGLYARIDRRPWPEALTPSLLVHDEHAPAGASSRVAPPGAHGHAPAGGSG